MEGSTKKCKHCKSEIDKKAKVCPHCRKKQGGVIKGVLVALLVVYFLAHVEITDSEPSSTETSESTLTETTVENETTTVPVVEDETVEEAEIVEETSADIFIELSEDEYKAQCREVYYDEVFFGTENLNGEKIKIHLMLSEKEYFTIDSLYSATLSEYMEKYDLHRNLFKCCVLREGEDSYVGRQISMWFSNHFDLSPDNYETGDKVTAYADVINWSNNTWDGYNSVTIIPRYIETE